VVVVVVVVVVDAFPRSNANISLTVLKGSGNVCQILGGGGDVPESTCESLITIRVLPGDSPNFAVWSREKSSASDWRKDVKAKQR